MTYAELGEMLRAEREKRHLTIEDAARELKINPRQLLALEEGDMKLLPHQAYAKGFIRAYASWLGIGNEEIHQILASLGMASPPPLISKDMPEPAPAKSGRRYLFPALILLVALASYFGWRNGAMEYLENLNFSKLNSTPKLQNAEDFISSRDEAERAKSEKNASPSRPSTSPTTSAAVSIENKVQPEVPAPPSAQVQAKEDNTQPSAPASAQESAPANEPSPEPRTAQAPADSANVSGQNKLIIIATEECWIHSNADKTDTRQFSLRKGDTFALTFAKSLELKLGNAGGVRLRYNGQDLPPPGHSGQVKTLSFPPANPS